MTEKAAVLQKMVQSKLFQYMSISDVDGLYKLGKPLSFKAGQTLIKEGEEGDEFFWILDGRVAISIGSFEGKSLELNILKEGDLLGEMVLLGKNRRTATAVAHSNCEVVCWKCIDCLKYFETDTHFGFRLMSNFAQILSDRIHSMNLQVRNSSSTPPAQEILKLLRST